MVVDGIAEGDGDEEDKAVVVETEVVGDAVADDDTVEDVHSNVVVG